MTTDPTALPKAETFAEVMKDMLYPRLVGCRWNTIMDNYDFANRLEAAHAREMAARDERIRELSEEVERLNSVQTSGLTGLGMITLERQRQISVEGWTARHDDNHADGEMALAAACYILDSGEGDCDDDPVPDAWPWHSRWWKPQDRIRNLVKAGALIAAELDRLNRTKGRTLVEPAEGEKCICPIRDREYDDACPIHGTPKPEEPTRSVEGSANDNLRFAILDGISSTAHSHNIRPETSGTVVEAIQENVEELVVRALRKDRDECAKDARHHWEYRKIAEAELDELQRRIERAKNYLGRCLIYRAGLDRILEGKE